MRNQVFAHRWNAKTPQVVFHEASVTPNMMKEITELAQSIICDLAEGFGGIKRVNIERIQLSNNTLQCIADDAGLVMGAFVATI